MKSLHLSHHGLEHLLLHVRKVEVHLILHLTSQPRNLRGHYLLHGCKVWVKIASWRSPLLLCWRMRWWHGMLSCSYSHVSIIITIIIIPLCISIHIISRERSQRPQKKSIVILEWPERSVLAFTYPSEARLDLDDGHNIWSKI